MAEQFIEIKGRRVGTGVDKSDWRKMSKARKQNIANNLSTARPQQAEAQAEPLSASSAEFNPVAEGFRSALGQGALLGFGDELEAAVRTGSFSSPEYKQTRDQLRAQQDAYREANPVISLATEVAGGFLLPGGVVANAARQGSKTAAQVLAREAAGGGSKLTRAALTGAGLGAGTGTIAGIGTADEMSDAAEGAREGAISGAVIGGALPGVGRALAGTTRAIGNRLGIGAAPFADRKIRQALAREGFTPQQAAERVKELQSQGVRGATLADLGTNTQDLAFAAQSVGNRMQTPVARQLAERFRGQAEEISDQMASRLGTTTEESADYLSNLAQAQQKAARAAYRPAYAVDLPADKFTSVLTNPRFKEIYETARELSDLSRMKAGDDTPPLPSFDEFQKLADRGMIPTEFLHQVKRGFDAVIEGGTDITGKMNAKAAKLAEIKRTFNDKIKELNPEYAKANKQFADFEQLKRANKMGADLDKTRSNVLVKKVAGMTDAEKAAFVRGVVDRFNVIVETTGENQDFVRQVFNKGRRRDAIKAAFPNTAEGRKAFNDFKDFMASQAQLAGTNRRVLGGSPTATRQQVLAESGKEPGDGIIDLLSTSDPMAAAARLASRGRTGMTEKSAEQTLETLFQTNPERLGPMINRLQRQQNQLARPKGPGLLGATLSSPSFIAPGGAAGLENLRARDRRQTERFRQGLLR
jgi:hypothetical protein